METNSEFIQSVTDFSNYSFPILNSTLLEDLFYKFQILKSHDSTHIPNQIHHVLCLYLPPIIFILGSFGNILAFLVLRHPSTRYVSPFVYLIARSIVDEIVLIVGLFRKWIDYLMGMKMDDTSAIICKVTQFIGTSSSLLSVWLTVALTAERAAVVSWPINASRWVTYEKVRKIIIIISLLCAAVSLHFFITVGLVPEGKLISLVDSSRSPASENDTKMVCVRKTNNSIKLPISRCSLKCAFNTEYEELSWLWTTIDATVYSYLPFCLMLGLNIIIVHHVRAAQRRQHHLRRHNPSKRITQAANTPDNPGNVRQLTVMLLVISFMFFATTVCIVIVKILAQLIDLRGPDKQMRRAVFRVADKVAEMLMYVNHASNFYLFCATGRRFRVRLLLLFSKVRRQGIRGCCNRPQHRYQMCSFRVSGSSNEANMNIKNHTFEGVLPTRAFRTVNGVRCSEDSGENYLLKARFTSQTVHCTISRSARSLPPTLSNCLSTAIGVPSGKCCFPKDHSGQVIFSSSPGSQSSVSVHSSSQNRRKFTHSLNFPKRYHSGGPHSYSAPEARQLASV